MDVAYLIARRETGSRGGSAAEHFSEGFGERLYRGPLLIVWVKDLPTLAIFKRLKNVREQGNLLEESIQLREAEQDSIGAY